jgi:hypothetical protein
LSLSASVQDVPIVRVALKEHGEAAGFSIAERLSRALRDWDRAERDGSALPLDAAAAAVDAARPGGHAMLSSASFALSRTQRQRVLRDAGFSHEDVDGASAVSVVGVASKDVADIVTDKDGGGCSPGSDGSSSGVPVPTHFVDDGDAPVAARAPSPPPEVALGTTAADTTAFANVGAAPATAPSVLSGARPAPPRYADCALEHMASPL